MDRIKTNAPAAMLPVIGALLIAVWMAACDVNPFNPPPLVGRLTVDLGEDLAAAEEDTLTLTATARGGDPPYVFRWSIEQVPDDPEIINDGAIPIFPDGVHERSAEDPSSSIETLRFEIGRYVYRVRVTDVAGETVADSVIIDVGRTPLRVSIAELEDEDDVFQAFSAEEFTLTAATNISGDYTYRWIQLAGPTVEFSVDDEAVAQLLAIEPERVILRVIVNDPDEGTTGSTDVTIDVEQGSSFRVLVEQPFVVVQDESGYSFTANITNETIDPDLLQYRWEVTNDADVEFTSPESKTTDLIGHGLETAELSVRVFARIHGRLRVDTAEFTTVVLPDLLPEFIMSVASDAADVNGIIKFEFDAEATPRTVANIVRYIDEGFYTRILWHRVAERIGVQVGDGPIGPSLKFVAQFGGFKRSGDDLVPQEPEHDPVESENETSLKHEPWTIGLALVGQDLNSGTAQIYVNMSDNSDVETDDINHVDLNTSGFTAFGRVIDGKDIITAMFDIEVGDDETDEGNTVTDVPVDDITILIFRRAVVTSPLDRDDDGSFTDPDKDDSSNESDEGGNFAGTGDDDRSSFDSDDDG